MAVIIGSARHDEHGSCYHGGTAGDQLQSGAGNDYSGEVSMQDFYVHSKGWYVLRPKSDAIANKIAERMEAACNNKHIGYDQDNRNGIIKYGIDTTTDTECDCSSLAREDVKEATGTDPGDFTTANEVTALENTGYFEPHFAYTSGTTLYTGDILVTKTKGHTAVVISGAARGTTSSGTTSSGTGTTSSTKLTVDGEIGRNTVKRLQQFCDVAQDGFIDGQPSSARQYWISIISEACLWSGGKSPTVRAFQKYLVDKGYYCGTKSSFKDGKLGKNTAKYAQTFLADKGYYSGSIDSIFGTNSAKALQNWLNSYK